MKRKLYLDIALLVVILGGFGVLCLCSTPQQQISRHRKLLRDAVEARPRLMVAVVEHLRLRQRKAIMCYNTCKLRKRLK